MKQLIVSLATLALCSCATRHQTYIAPDPAKMNESASVLTGKVAKATDTAKKARAKVADIKTGTQKVSASIKQSEQDANDLYNVVPAQYKPQVLSLESAIQTAQLDLNTLSTGEDEAETLHAQLAKELDDAKVAKEQLEKDQATYVSDAGKLANSATVERDKRIKDEQSLSWYRWHWWGSWIVLGIGVLVCILLAVAKLAGKLALL